MHEREWFDRLLEERDELRERVKKLTDFLATNGVELMSPAELLSLNMQNGYMGLYLSVLEERIERNS